MIRTKPIVAFFAALLMATCLAATPGTASEGHGRVYMFRGLIGLIDWGMDDLAARIDRTGVTASVNSHMVWRSVADQAIADYHRDPEPITVIGHSIGGDSAVSFAKTLDAAGIRVNLLVTYDPTRMSDNVPSNVERYINLYQSSNFLGGGDLVQGHGFHGHYASFNLKDRPEIIHINLDKFDRIQEQLVSKIRSLGATPARSEGEAVPIRIDIPASATIELWDSGLPVSAHAGDTLQTIATKYHVPVWAVAQINKTPETATLTEGQRIVVPRYLTPGGAASPAAAPAH